MESTFFKAEPCSSDELRRHGQLALDALTYANAHLVDVEFYGTNRGVKVRATDGRAVTAESLPEALKALGLWRMP